MRVRGAFASVAVAISLTAAPAAVASPRQATIVGGLGARTISTSVGSGKTTGTLDVLVRNDSHHYARPTARFIPATASRPEFRHSAKLLRPGQVEAVSLSFSATSAGAMKGTVAIGLSGKRTVREQTFPVAPEAPASVPAIEPAEVTLHLTRLCPLGHILCGSSPVPTIAVSASALAALGSAGKRLAASDSGGRATITLVPVQPVSGTRIPQGLVPVKVYVRDDSHGEYTTTFTLDPEAKQDGAIKVKVEVQVWWLYPLLVLLAGAFLGYLVRWIGGSYRERDVLKASLLEAREDYEPELSTRSLGMYPLERWFGPFTDAVPAIPRTKEYDSRNLSGFAECWQQAQQAKSANDVAVVEKTLKELQADVATWRRINAALQRLDDSFRESVPDERTRALPIPAYRDTFLLIANETVTPPADAKTEKDILAAIALQGQIVKAYEPARLAWNLVTDDTGELKQYDPKEIYGDRINPLTREDAKSKAVREALKEAPAVLAQHAVPGAQAAAEAAPAAAPAPAAAAATVTEPTRPEQAPPKRKRDPFHLRREITLRDWIVFSLTLLASSVVYLLTLYVGKNFGSANQYVQAFAAGFAGQALAGVSAFPLAQSLLNAGDKPSGS